MYYYYFDRLTIVASDFIGFFLLSQLIESRRLIKRFDHFERIRAL